MSPQSTCGAVCSQHRGRGLEPQCPPPSSEAGWLRGVGRGRPGVRARWWPVMCSAWGLCFSSPAVPPGRPGPQEEPVRSQPSPDPAPFAGLWSCQQQCPKKPNHEKQHHQISLQLYEPASSDLPALRFHLSVSVSLSCYYNSESKIFFCFRWHTKNSII